MTGKQETRGPEVVDTYSTLQPKYIFSHFLSLPQSCPKLASNNPSSALPGLVQFYILDQSIPAWGEFKDENLVGGWLRIREIGLRQRVCSHHGRRGRGRSRSHLFKLLR